MRGGWWLFHQDLPALRPGRKPLAAQGIDGAFIEPYLFALAESQANLIIEIRLHRRSQPSPIGLVVEILKCCVCLVAIRKINHRRLVPVSIGLASGGYSRICVYPHMR